MSVNWEAITVVAAIIIAVIIGLYFGGSGIASAGGYISNSSNGSFFAWIGVPVGSFLVTTGNAWVQSLLTITGGIVIILIVGGLAIYYTNK